MELGRGRDFVLHTLDGPSPLPGWVVLTGLRHARAWYDLDAGALGSLGPLAAKVMQAQREVLGAEHVYALALGDVLQHFHLHLVPRFADTPKRWWGRGAFEAGPADALEAGVLTEAGRRLGAALSSLPL